MTDEEKTTIRAIAGDVVGGLKNTPLLLGVLILNVVGIVAAVWFLHKLVEVSSKNMQTLLTACLPK